VTSVVWQTGMPLRRGHKYHYAAQDPVPALAALPAPEKMTRFAPVLGAPHAYVARRETAALLESVLHDAVPATPRIRWHQLSAWSLSHVRLSRQVRLIDLRDPALGALGIEREQLVATDPAHYPCTRQWAERIQGRRVGGQETEGLVWHSRQAELHASQGVRPLLADVLVGEQAEVAVLWPADVDVLEHAAGPWTLSAGRGFEIMRDVANLIGAPPPLTGPGTH
jgi:hypothetical protein